MTEEMERAIAKVDAKVLELQERRAELDFLGQQVTLLELIQKHDLAAAKVMRGLSLGVRADARKLLGTALTALNFARS